jgi:phospholipid/cholesterol/gamma-HCH transport system ATP-binding protein
MVQHSNDSSRTAGAAPAVEIHDLRKFSLRGVNLTIGPRERVAVIGKTGEGKSVLLRCLLGLLRAEAGELRLLDKEVRRRTIATPGLGVAFQSPGLFDAWSVADNLRAASRSPLGRDEVISLLKSVALSGVPPESSVTQLSGGQQKRLAMLRAMLRGSELLILDEPTSGLDPATSAGLAAMLVEEFRKRPRALLLITHDYETAVRLCDRTVILRNGCMEDIGTSGSNPALDAAILRAAVAEDNISPVSFAKPPAARGILQLTLGFLGIGAPLAAVAMVLIGAMLVAQSAHVGTFDVSRFIPGAVVFAVFREMAPLVVGLLLASRIGSHVGAELAGMSYTAQIDSMRALGLSPLRRLLLPFVVSAAITFPLCIALGAVCGVLAAAYYAGIPSIGLSIGTRRFFDLARDVFELRLVVSLLVKGVAMAAAVVVASYWCGTRSVSSAYLLGRLVTRAAVLGSASVVLVDVVGSAVFFR